MSWDDTDSDPMDDIRKWTCPHRPTTDPDENGDAICLRCGTVVEIRFNLERFRERMRKLFEGP